MNLTLIFVILVFLCNLIKGCRKGAAKEISTLIALIVTFFVLCLMIMLFTSFKAGEMTNTFYTIILLIILGLVYGVIKMVLKSVKAISELPFLRFFDKVLGMVIGILETVVFVWILFSLCAANFFGPVSMLVMNDIQNSTILTTIYEYNFLHNISGIAEILV